VSHLLRGQAPVTEAGWVLLDSEARERLTPALAARRLVDFAGPHGWAHSATNLGRTQDLADSPEEGVAARQRRVLGLVELRAPFTIPRTELEGADRGAEDIELGALDEAAHRIARAENSAVFHAWSAAGIAGVIEASPHEQITLGEDCERYPRHVAKAVDSLRAAGIEGDYGLALGPDIHTRVLETSQHGGYPLLEHLREILGGPIVWAPAVDGGAVLSMRGAISSSSAARTSRSGTRTTMRTTSTCIWRRASASGWRLPRRPCRFQPEPPICASVRRPRRPLVRSRWRSRVRDRIAA
jgi:uncharacterized linocin/CFP29 family protein